MKEINVRNENMTIKFTESVEVTYGSACECIRAFDGNGYSILTDSDGDQVRIFNTDIDALIRALQALKEYI